MSRQLIICNNITKEAYNLRRILNFVSLERLQADLAAPLSVLWALKPYWGSDGKALGNE